MVKQLFLNKIFCIQLYFIKSNNKVCSLGRTIFLGGVVNSLTDKLKNKTVKKKNYLFHDFIFLRKIQNKS